MRPPTVAEMTGSVPDAAPHRSEARKELERLRVEVTALRRQLADATAERDAQRARAETAGSRLAEAQERERVLAEAVVAYEAYSEVVVIECGKQPECAHKHVDETGSGCTEGACPAQERIERPLKQKWDPAVPIARAILAGERPAPSATTICVDSASAFAVMLTDEEAERLYEVLVEHMPPSDVYCPADASDQERVAIALRFLARAGEKGDGNGTDA